MESLGSRYSFLSILGCLWGVSRGPLWRHVCDFSLIWGVDMGDGFQVHVFSDPGMEMMPMQWLYVVFKQSKTGGF